MGTRRKVFIIISKLEYSQGFAWLTDGLDKSKIDLTYILLNPGPSKFSDFLKSKNIKVINISFKSKLDLPFILFKLLMLFIKEKPKVVHAHLFDASLTAMLAAKLAGVENRIYTRHHSTYHHVYHPHAIKYDRLINKCSTHIIAVSEVVKRVLMDREKVKGDKVSIIHHCIEENDFVNISDKRIQALKSKWNIQQQQKVIGVISRFTEWKGVQYIIDAFIELWNNNKNLKLVLANANGDYKVELQMKLHQLPTVAYQEIEFELDIAALYKCFDVFVHVPVDDHSEAFGQIYIEAMMASCACVFTKSGIGNSILQHEQNCLLVDYKNSKQIRNAIQRILDQPTLKQKLGQNAHKEVSENFHLSKMIDQHQAIYLA
ncbi:MAG TPA: glycosyltransferase family 4 protein [Bacteroidia bacterium]|nr:glycosyltransferase family 4 protein [Bacteroidia bacterium]